MGEQLAVFIDFENVALWAEQEFFDFEVSALMEYLKSRGPAVVKKAYGDWSRFSRYKDGLMNNSIDLIQIYSVRAGKNRADIRMAIDAFEIAMTRDQINNFVIVSGDSDFGPLVSKLREYGRYTLGIGPRNITHQLLINSYDEFIYLETALGEPTDAEDASCIEIEQARNILNRSLQVHGQRGEIPVLATRLKQTMLLMDPAFNEANFGYAQFKNWLEDNRDLAQLFLKDLQLYVAPIDYIASTEIDDGKRELEKEAMPILPPNQVLMPSKLPLDAQYRQVFNRLKVSSLDLTIRRDVLRDIFREINDHPGERTTDEILDLLVERYQAQGLMRSKSMLRDIFQLAFRQHTFDYKEYPISLSSPVWLEREIKSEAMFVERGESDLIYEIVRAGLEIDATELAYIILSDRNQVEYIQTLLNDLKNRKMIAYKNNRYCLPEKSVIPFTDVPSLQILIRDIERVKMPDNLKPGLDSAHSLAKKAMLQRSQDFAASSGTYLLACKLQWEAILKGESGGSIEDLRWYLASYASAIAGRLSQVDRNYAAARPYYLAFFTLVQEEDTLWSRMRGLINPMLAYYWANAGRELDLNVGSWNLNMASPAQIAVLAANHPNPDLRNLWQKITVELAQVNPGLLRRISNQLMLNRSDNPENLKVAEQINGIISSVSSN